uniref:Envelope protein n=1 Tax=Suricata suricatta TaxID=37032 RepID=A0A673U312_SURSU
MASLPGYMRRTSKQPRPTETGMWKRLKTPSSFAFVGCLLLLLTLFPISNPNPHQPFNLTWIVINTATGDTLVQNSSVAPRNTWFPDLTLDLQDLVKSDSYNPASSLQSRSLLKEQWFYVCPGHKNSDRAWRQICGGNDHYFCAAWACISTGDIWWSAPVKDDLITVRRADSRPQDYLQQLKRIAMDCSRNNKCNPIVITFTEKGKSDNRWENGHSWGLRLYTSGHRNLPATLFTIRLIVRPIILASIGPSQMLSRLPKDDKPQIVPSPQTQKPLCSTPSPVVSPPPSRFSPLSSSMAPTKPGPVQRLYNLVKGAYLALNQTSPDSTESCWLCLTSSPPYYQGIAFPGQYNLTDSHSSCDWGTTGKITLTEVFGRGTCIGRVPPDYRFLCNQTTDNPLRIPADPTNNNNKYLVPHSGWWACNTGLTPCVSSAFNQSRDYCIMVQILPKITYYKASSFEDMFRTHSHLYKREPVSVTLAVLLSLGVVAGIGTSTTALVHGSQNYEALRASIDEDLKMLEQSITHLEKSLTSLSEVVLQNRRGLDLLFLQQGGLCAALNEECCFYSDHSGVVRDSMAKLRERLSEREENRKAQQGWFESWFNKSPWFTTLISTLLGPIVILILLLTFGPCIVNRLVAFVRERVSAVQILLLRQQYQAVGLNEAETAVL